jgi:redox-sensing transcriptional repressor
MANTKISDATVKRLPIYLRFLERQLFSGIQTISSNVIGRNLNFNAAQVRKDLSFFGEFGQKGVGYHVETLIREIEEILNLDQFIPVCLVGVGHLGHALCNFDFFQKDKMRIVSVFDKDPQKIGLEINDLVVQPLENFKKDIKDKKIKIGIITVPYFAAQRVADAMIDSGISAILNYSPTSLSVPENVRVHSTDFIADLHSLAYYLSNSSK